MSSGGNGAAGGEPASTSSGGVTAAAAGASLSAEAGSLFTSSPLRHRFRTGRRGSAGGWSSSSVSSVAAGWSGGATAAAAGGGDGERGVGAAPSTFLRKVFKVTRDVMCNYRLLRRREGRTRSWFYDDVMAGGCCERVLSLFYTTRRGIGHAQRVPGTELQGMMCTRFWRWACQKKRKEISLWVI